MNIVNPNALIINGFVRVKDIDFGECFQFLDEETLYMRAGDYFFSVADGVEIFNVYEDEVDTPVRRVETELKILKEDY